MARFLVTGGCGFVGTRLVGQLMAAGHRVAVLDDLSNGRIDRLHGDAALIIGSATDPAMVALAADGVDGCFHLAATLPRCAVTGTPDPQRKASDVLAAATVFGEAKRREVPVVYASSGAVYGADAGESFTETAQRRPASTYAVDKIDTETLAEILSDQGLRAVGLRLFRLYGPGQEVNAPYVAPLAQMLDRMCRRQPVMLRGDGRRPIDFLHVDDACAAMGAAMTRLLAADGKIEPVLNLSGHRPVSHLQLVGLIGQVCSTTPDVRFDPDAADDMAIGCGISDLAHLRLGLKPRIALEHGLAELVALDRQRRSLATRAVASAQRRASAAAGVRDGTAVAAGLKLVAAC